jgi:hypothetical protein
MSNGDRESLHGHVGSGPGAFSRLLGPDPHQPAKQELQVLGAVGVMEDQPDTASGHPDLQAHVCVPVGYTYCGRLVDHDITFDTTSTLDTTSKVDIADRTTFTSQRMPSLDLAGLDGPGPDTAPYMDQDGVKLVERVNGLPSQAGRAIVGDARNDENSSVRNMQMALRGPPNGIAGGQRPAATCHSRQAAPRLVRSAGSGPRLRRQRSRLGARAFAELPRSSSRIVDSTRDTTAGLRRVNQEGGTPGRCFVHCP